MSHHDKGKTKRKGSSCGLCKPHKRQGVDDPRRQERRARISEREQVV